MSIPETSREHIKMLDWVIRFAQQQLSELREGDWINLAEEINAFLWSSRSPTPNSLLGIARRVDFTPEPGWHNLGAEMKKLYSRENIVAAQAAILKDLNQLAIPLSGYAAGRVTQPIEHIKIGVQNFTPSLPFKHVIDVDRRDLTSQVRCAFFEYLVRSGIRASQLRTCPNHDCRHIFLVKRRPRTDMKHYCSLRCSRLAATRNYRARQTKKSKRSTSSRQKSQK